MPINHALLWSKVRKPGEKVVRFGTIGWRLAMMGGVFLVGGASRIPLVATLLHRALGEPPLAIEQPELVVAEGSLYVRADARGTGLGKRLSEALIETAESEGIWTLELWIFPENRTSIALCESLGFRIVGIRERIGRREGRWRDVVVMERRSDVVGADLRD